MSSNHVTTQGHCSWTTLSTESGERCQQKADARDMPLTRRSAARTRRSFSNLSPAQRDRKRRNDRESQRGIRQRTKDYIQQLELRVQKLEYWLAAKNAADNKNVASGMPMDLGHNMGADTANTKWPIDTDNNMVSAFGNETSTGDIYNGEEGGYAFSSHIMQQPRESLASGNLYTTDLNNSFHEDLPEVGQPLKYRRLIPFSTKFQQ